MLKREDIENGMVLDNEHEYKDEPEDEYYEEQELERIRNLPDRLGSHCIKPLKED